MPKGVYKKSEQHKKNLSMANKGKKLSLEHKIKIGQKSKISMLRLWKNSEYKARMVKISTGRKLSDEIKKKVGDAARGRKYSEEYKKFKSDLMKGRFTGKEHWNWQGGITPINKVRISTFKWKQIRRQVYKRDNWTCQRCHKKGFPVLQCHHKIPYRISKDDSLDNLITLCRSCHTKEDMKYSLTLIGYSPYHEKLTEALIGKLAKPMPSVTAEELGIKLCGNKEKYRELLNMKNCKAEYWQGIRDALRHLKRLADCREAILKEGGK